MAALVSGVLLFLTVPAFAQEFASPPIVVQPLMAPTPKAHTPAPPVVVPDTHVESTELGFETGIGPAVGRTVTYHNKQYEVTDVSAIDGGPAFCGGSRFAIAPAGHRLLVGLKVIDPEKLAALPSSPRAFIN